MRHDFPDLAVQQSSRRILSVKTPRRHGRVATGELRDYHANSIGLIGGCRVASAANVRDA